MYVGFDSIDAYTYTCITATCRVMSDLKLSYWVWHLIVGTCCVPYQIANLPTIPIINDNDQFADEIAISGSLIMENSPKCL